MSGDDIFKIFIAIISSVGGIGTVIVLIVKWCSNIIADKLSQKYELKMNKELEKYKAGIANKTYMSKTKFDTEFLMYRELSQTFAILVKECSQLFPTFTKDVRNDYNIYKSIYNKCVNVIVNAQDKLNSCAPFISDSIFQAYMELEKLCKKQLNDFEYFRLQLNAKDYIEECLKEYRAAYKRTRIINDNYRQISTDLRKYIESIDVLE